MSKTSQQLKDLIEKVRQELAAQQQQIRSAETSYLKDNTGFSSLLKGLDSLINKQTRGSSYSLNRQSASQRTLKDSERIFSGSSADCLGKTTELELSLNSLNLKRKGAGKTPSAMKRQKRDDEDTDLSESF